MQNDPDSTEHTTPNTLLREYDWVKHSDMERERERGKNRKAENIS